MKKWALLILTAGVLVYGCVGCGTQEAENAGAPANVSENEAQMETQQPQDEESTKEQAEGVAEDSNDNYNDLEEKGSSGEVTAFAEAVQAAMAEKDMEALAGLCSYPVGVNGEVVEDRGAFMELGADVVFTDKRCAVIAGVDVSSLEETMAGVVMGEATPNIIFKSVDGKLGITGIN